jgi:cystathionine beta-lyase
MAPSKTFNLAGLFCSFAVIENPDLRRRFTHAQEGRGGAVNLLGLVAAEAAYRDGQEWLDQLLVYLEENRNYLFNYIHGELNGIQMAVPEGTYRLAGLPRS